MDSSITAAGRALRAGDPLGALKRVALREDPAALALRGIAMAQLDRLARLRSARVGRAGALPDGRGGGGAGGARRSSSRARPRSPSWAIAIPRSARAAGSSRRATRLSAPRGSPARSARPAAVIAESIA